MQMYLSFGAPESDVVLSGQDLISIVECIADQGVTEEPQAQQELKIVFTSECQDLRVGERASKRRRNAGTAAALEHISSQKGGRTDRQNGASQGVDDDTPMPAGPLPKGWKVFYRVIGDGRKCEHHPLLVACMTRLKRGINHWTSGEFLTKHIFGHVVINYMSGADKVYQSPYGRVFQTYTKAKLYWEQDRRKPAGLNSKRSAAQQPEGDTAKDWPSPESLISLISWLRETSMGIPTAVIDGHFREAVLRARATILDVRSTRRL